MVSWKMQIDLIWWSQAVHQSNFGRKKLFLKNINSCQRLISVLLHKYIQDCGYKFQYWYIL